MDDHNDCGNAQPTSAPGTKRKRSNSSDSQDGTSSSKTRKISRGQWKKSTDSTRVSSSWAFTDTARSNVNEIHGNALVLIGPSEGGGAHGMLLLNFNEELRPRRRTRISKKQAVKILAESGIRDIDCVQPVRKPTDYVTYIYKTAPSIPSAVEENLNSFEFQLKRKGSPFIESLKKHRETFTTKPTFAEWKHSCLSTIGEDLANQQIINVYNTWPKNFGKLDKAIMFVENQKKPVTLSSAMNAIRSIGRNITNCNWDGKSFGRAETLAFMWFAGIRGRSKHLKGLPHFIFKGSAGAGKSKIIDLLWSPQTTHIICGDSEGVGKFVCHYDTSYYVADDVNLKTFTQEQFTRTIWTMFENKWNIKTFGGTEEKSEMRCILTTNIENVKQLISLNNDAQAYTRRFAEVTFRKNDSITFDGTVVDENLRSQIMINLCVWIVNWMKHAHCYDEEGLSKRQNHDFLREIKAIYESTIENDIEVELHEPDYAFEDYQPYGTTEQRTIQRNVFIALQNSFNSIHKNKMQKLYWYMRNKNIPDSDQRMKDAIEWCELQSGMTVDANTQFCITNEGVIAILNHRTGEVMKYTI